MRQLICLVLFILLSFGSLVLWAGDKYSGTPAARAEFAKGQAASQANEWAKAAADYKKAREIDPNYAEAYSQYMFARMREALGDVSLLGHMSKADQEKLEQRMKEESQDVIKEYKDLVSNHPDMPIYLWALAQNYNETNPELQEKYCKEAVKMDPKFAPGYECISQVASLGGDTQTAAAALRQAIALEPEKMDLLRQLQWMYRDFPQQYKAVTDEVVHKVPDTKTAVEALSSYDESLPLSERISALEDLIARYPPQKFPAASEAANTLFNDYDRTDPVKSTALAHKMLAEMPKSQDWKAKAAYCDAMSAAEAKVAAGEGQSALAILKDVKVPGFTLSKSRLQLLKAKAQDVSGNTAAAYSDLLKIFSEQPLPELQSALDEYGKKLGKSTSTVDEEISKTRAADAKPAIPFTLESFVDDKKVSLNDFKGKVVLLDFWYPNCGPCRQSMPYLQRLYSKYKDSGLVFLGVNGVEQQAAYVMPLVKSRGWGMIPLRGNSKWCAEVYKVQGFPSTFLIGTDGRVYFKTHVYDHLTYQTAKMQIEALLPADQERTKQ